MGHEDQKMIPRRGPKYPKKGKNLRPKAKNQEDQNAAFGGNQATTTAVGTTAWTWWTQRAVVATTA